MCYDPGWSRITRSLWTGHWLCKAQTLVDSIRREEDVDYNKNEHALSQEGIPTNHPLRIKRLPEATPVCNTLGKGPAHGQFSGHGGWREEQHERTEEQAWDRAVSSWDWRKERQWRQWRSPTRHQSPSCKTLPCLNHRHPEKLPAEPDSRLPYFLAGGHSHTAVTAQAWGNLLHHRNTTICTRIGGWALETKWMNTRRGVCW